MVNPYGSGHKGNVRPVDMSVWGCLGGVKPHNGLLRNATSTRGTRGNPTPDGWTEECLTIPFIPITKERDTERRQTAKRDEEIDKKDFTNLYVPKEAEQTHFKNAHVQSLREPAERCRLQALIYFVRGRVQNQSVVQLVEVLPQVQNNPASVSLAIKFAGGNQSNWKCRTLRWATVAAFEVVDSSGGNEKWNDVSPEQRIAIWTELFMEAPGQISENALAGVNTSVDLKAIWHCPAIPKKWKKFVRAQVVRILDMAYLYRIKPGPLWNTKHDPRAVKPEKKLKTEWLLRTTELGHYEINDVNQVPSYANRQMGKSKKAKTGVQDRPMPQTNDDDFDDE